MMLYCKNCHHTHAAWTQLNDGLICGRCGARERNPQIIPLTLKRLEREPRTARRLKSA